jgi:hypothetical protein
MLPPAADSAPGAGTGTGRARLAQALQDQPGGSVPPDFGSVNWRLGPPESVTTTSKARQAPAHQSCGQVGSGSSTPVRAGTARRLTC